MTSQLVLIECCADPLVSLHILAQTEIILLIMAGNVMYHTVELIAYESFEDWVLSLGLIALTCIFLGFFIALGHITAPFGK